MKTSATLKGRLERVGVGDREAAGGQWLRTSIMASRLVLPPSSAMARVTIFQTEPSS